MDLTIVSGWLGTHWIFITGFEAELVDTRTFSVPIVGTIFYRMTASKNTLSFSVGSVIGAALGTYSKGQFRWKACEDPRELRRQIFGAVSMGLGAILAAGCNIDQGISAFRVIPYRAPFASIAIFTGGGTFGLRQLIAGFALVE